VQLTIVFNFESFKEASENEHLVKSYFNEAIGNVIHKKADYVVVKIVVEEGLL